MLKTLSGRNPSQDQAELMAFITLLQKRGVKRYLEVGARHGDTFHEVLRHLPRGAAGVAVDLPGGLWGTGKSRDHLKASVRDLRERGYEASCIFGDSQTVATQQLVAGRGPYDAILLDGDHTYDGVRRDWEGYRGMAPLIAFHDIVGYTQSERVHGNRVEVPRLWAEIKASGYNVLEFISPGSKMGIGVVLCA